MSGTASVQDKHEYLWQGVWQGRAGPYPSALQYGILFAPRPSWRAKGNCRKAGEVGKRGFFSPDEERLGKNVSIIVRKFEMGTRDFPCEEQCFPSRHGTAFQSVCVGTAVWGRYVVWYERAGKMIHMFQKRSPGGRHSPGGHACTFPSSACVVCEAS